MNPILIIIPVVVVIFLVSVSMVFAKKRNNAQMEFMNIHRSSAFFFKDRNTNAKFKVKVNGKPLKEYDHEAGLYAVEPGDNTTITIEKSMELPRHRVVKRGAETVSTARFGFTMGEELNLVIPTNAEKKYGISICSFQEHRDMYNNSSFYNIVEEVIVPVSEGFLLDYGITVLVYERTGPHMMV